jgi:hypothetical protein
VDDTWVPITASEKKKLLEAIEPNMRELRKRMDDAKKAEEGGWFSHSHVAKLLQLVNRTYHIHV